MYVLMPFVKLNEVEYSRREGNLSIPDEKGI